ncbi:MAG: formate dehydrogenase accessory sulfurtransferase FdhD [Bacteroidota bacterium]
MYARVAEVSVEKYTESTVAQRNDVVALEEPLEIVLLAYQKRAPVRIPVAITMRTPGDDKHLSLGLLFAEGIISSMDDVTRVEEAAANTRDKPFTTAITVYLKDHVPVDPASFARQFPSTSSCGICGRLELPDIRTRESSQAGPSVKTSLLYTLPAKARQRQTLFQHTGGIHSAALFDSEGNLMMVAEDIGRHNALDKLIGRALVNGTLLSDAMLLLSGRVSYELMQKAIAARIRCVFAIGAPSSLAVELACTYDVTLIGFLKENRFNVYAGKQRILPT